MERIKQMERNRKRQIKDDIPLPHLLLLHDPVEAADGDEAVDVPGGEQQGPNHRQGVP